MQRIKQFSLVILLAPASLHAMQELTLDKEVHAPALTAVDSFGRDLDLAERNYSFAENQNHLFSPIVSRETAANFELSKPVLYGFGFMFLYYLWLLSNQLRIEREA